MGKDDLAIRPVTEAVESKAKLNAIASLWINVLASCPKQMFELIVAAFTQQS